MPTGPDLCTRLAAVELDRAEDDELLEVLSAQARQLAYQQAQVWATMAEIARRDPMPHAVPRLSPEQVFDSAVDEVRAELSLTRRSAIRELSHADAVAAQPAVLAALGRGELDRSRAIVLAAGCFDLTAGQAAILLDKVLPDAAHRSATALADRVRRIAVALDPGWAERRYRNEVRARRVIGYLNPDGSATVSAQYLPVRDAVAACARVAQLADTAKRAGASTTVDYLRAELFLGLLDGRFAGFSEPQIVDALCRRFPTAPESADGIGDPTDRERVGTTESASVASETPLGTIRGAELKIGLGTLLGLDEQPGEIAGWGTITASVARDIAAGSIARNGASPSSTTAADCSSTAPRAAGPAARHNPRRPWAASSNCTCRPHCCCSPIWRTGTLRGPVCSPTSPRSTRNAARSSRTRSPVSPVADCGATSSSCTSAASSPAADARPPVPIRTTASTTYAAASPPRTTSHRAAGTIT